MARAHALKHLDPLTERCRFREGSDSLLAIEPRAALALHKIAAGINEGISTGDDGRGYHYELDGDVAIVRVFGPLEQRASFLWDGYDDIECRFGSALACADAKSVVLLIDSPGGEAAGCFDAVRRMRAAAEASGKRVVTFADEAAYSAAYALATVADEIVLPQAGGLGSIGVIATVYDRTELTKREGLNVVVLKSGDEKADGHPDVPLDDETLTRMQARVDDLAVQFAALVAESRGGDADKWLALQAGVRYGVDAVSAGLADRVQSFADLLNELRSATVDSQQTDTKGKQQMSLKVLQANLEAAQRAGDAAKIAEAQTALLAAKKADEDADEEESEEGADDDEGDESEDAEDPPADDDDDEDEDEDAEGEDAEDAEDEEADEDADADSKYGKKSKKADASRIARAAAQLTGKSDPDEIVGTLRGLVASARQGRESTARLAKIETRLRKADVEKLIAKGVRERKITPASKAHFERIGMRSPKELKAMLKAMAPVAAPPSRERDNEPQLRDGYHQRPTDAAEQVMSNFGLTPDAFAAEAAKLGNRFPRN